MHDRPKRLIEFCRQLFAHVLIACALSLFGRCNAQFGSLVPSGGPNFGGAGPPVGGGGGGGIGQIPFIRDLVTLGKLGKSVSDIAENLKQLGIGVPPPPNAAGPAAAADGDAAVTPPTNPLEFFGLNNNRQSAPQGGGLFNGGGLFGPPSNTNNQRGPIFSQQQPRPQQHNSGFNVPVQQPTQFFPRHPQQQQQFQRRHVQSQPAFNNAATRGLTPIQPVNQVPVPRAQPLINDPKFNLADIFNPNAGRANIATQQQQPFAGGILNSRPVQADAQPFLANPSAAGSGPASNSQPTGLAQLGNFQIPQLDQFVREGNFGLKKGEGCIPLLGDLVRVLFADCQQTADNRQWQAWGGHLSGALFDGKLDVLKAAKQTCKLQSPNEIRDENWENFFAVFYHRHQAEREHCQNLVDKVATCDILGAIAQASALEQQKSRCDQLTLLQLQPQKQGGGNKLLSTLANFLGSEVSHGFLQNFLG